MGWDAFGLPAENEAIKMERPPAVTTERNIANYQRQMDLSASATTGRARSLPASPTTTAGRSGSSCCSTSAGWPTARRAATGGARCDKTVLANEQVEDGRCWRCGSLVDQEGPRRSGSSRSPTTRERLLDDLDDLDWPEQIKPMQRNWIGRSEGAEVDFGPAGPRRASSRSSPPGPTRSSAPPSWCWRRSIRWSTQLTTPEQRDASRRLPGRRRAAQSEIERPVHRARRRPASSPAPTPSTRSTTSASRSGSPTTC